MPPRSLAPAAENIGPRERRKRRIVGVAALIVALAVFAFLLYLRAPRVLRLGLFPPLWFAGLGWFQAQACT